MAGALDEDTARTLASGRQRVGSLLSAAQHNLKKIFLVFVAVFLGTFYALRIFVWDRLREDLVFGQMDPRIAADTEIVATTPFEVILLQVKIGLILGVLVTIPVAVWYSRASLKRRGRWPESGIPRWKIWTFMITIIFLFFGGLSYAYFFFFPIMFDFLATNAVNAGFRATWSIAMWTEFILFLGLSFGLAAQLPLAMSATARAGIVKYETFRDKWRYAVVAIFVFGAMFSPPDPFTQIMWGVPLVALYFISLGITKLAVTSKRAGESVPVSLVVRENWNTLAGASVLTVAFMYAFMLEGGTALVNDALESIGSDYRLAEGAELGVLGLSPSVVVILVGVLTAGIVVAQLIFYYRLVELERIVEERAREEAGAASETDPGEPAEIDISAMSARAIEAASPEVFIELSEERTLHYAEEAIENNDPQKAQAIFDKFDEAQELEEQRQAEQAEEEEEDDENFVTSTAAGMIDPFTEDDTTEDDIGGYYYDIQFIIESLTSKTIWIVVTFMAVLGGSFMAMYMGGIGYAQDVFFANMPAGTADDAGIVVLHPVEALIFMLKLSTLLAFLSILPMLLYFAWPAIEQRGLAAGNRNVLLVWGGTMFLALFGGTLLGFLYIAPTIISLLAWDVVNADMIIAYRISSFGWLVIYLTVGVGILAMIPTTMLLFHHGSIVSYGRMRQSWRVVVIGFFAIAGFASPSGIFTMFLVAIPASIAYGFGLGLLWLYTRVERRVPKPAGETAD